LHGRNPVNYAVVSEKKLDRWKNKSPPLDAVALKSD
jgi:hypothetical protein